MILGFFMRKVSLYEVYNFLPKTDCKQCGLSCMGFAGFLVTRDITPEDCPVLLENQYSEALARLREMFGEAREKDPLTGFILEPETCNGCGICVVACESSRAEEAGLPGSAQDSGLSDKAPLRVKDGRVDLVHPEFCSRATNSTALCRACQELCPSSSILLV